MSDRERRRRERDVRAGLVEAGPPLAIACRIEGHHHGPALERLVAGRPVRLRWCARCLQVLDAVTYELDLVPLSEVDLTDVDLGEFVDAWRWALETNRRVNQRLARLTNAWVAQQRGAGSELEDRLRRASERAGVQMNRAREREMLAMNELARLAGRDMGPTADRLVSPP